MVHVYKNTYDLPTLNAFFAFWQALKVAVQLEENILFVLFSFQIVIDCIPHVRSHFESIYHKKKENSGSNNNNENGRTLAIETKQMEDLQRQFNQVRLD